LYKIIKKIVENVLIKSKLRGGRGKGEGSSVHLLLNDFIKKKVKDYG